MEGKKLVDGKRANQSDADSPRPAYRDGDYEYSRDICPEPLTPDVVEAAAQAFRREGAVLANQFMTKALAASSAPVEFTIGEMSSESQISHPGGPPSSISYADDAMLGVDEIRALCDCGVNQAKKILQALPSHKIGRKRIVYYKDYKAYIEEHGDIKIRWY